MQRFSVKVRVVGEAGCIATLLFVSSRSCAGATICKPSNPDCTACPLQAVCVAHTAETSGIGPAVTSYPAKAAAITKKQARAVACVMLLQKRDAANEAQQQVLLVKRSEKGLLAGMWEVPTAEVTGEESNKLAAALSLPEAQQAASKSICGLIEDEDVVSLLQASVQGAQACGSFVHQFSHISLTTDVLRCSMQLCSEQWEALTQACSSSSGLKLVPSKQVKGAGASTLTMKVLQAANSVQITGFVAKRKQPTVCKTQK